MSNNSLAAFGGGLAGAAVGSFFGPAGASLGFSLGAAAGSALVPLQLPDQVGPRLDDLEVTSSAFGQPIPLLWGSNRVSARLIFSSGKKEKKHKEDSGGKGGPEQTQVTYSYSLDAAYSLGNLPPSASSMLVRKIWINSQLVYDISETVNAVSLEKSTKLAAAVTIYDGAETQLPSSLQESYKGVGNVPAYRGMGIIEFDDLQLAQFGNGAINVSCEVVVAPTLVAIPYSINAWAGTDGGKTGQRDTCAAYDNGTILTAHDENIGGNDFWDHVVRRHDLEGNILSEQRKFINMGNVLSASTGIKYTWNDPMMIVGSGGDFPTQFRFAKFDGISDYGPESSPPTHPYNASNRRSWGDSSVRYKWMKWGDYFYVAGGKNSDTDGEPVYMGRFPIITDITNQYFGYPSNDSDLSVSIGATHGEVVRYITFDYKKDRIYTVGLTGLNFHIARWDRELNLIAQWDMPTISIPDHVRGHSMFSDDKILMRNSVDTTHQVLLYEFDPDVSNSAISLVKLTNLSGASNADNVHPLTEGLALTQGHIISIDPLVNQEAVTLATIIGDILELCGADSADFDVSTLTDTALGYKAGTLASARRSLEPIMRAFFIDAAEVDNKIVFTKRGGASVDTIPDDDLISVNQALVTVTRGSELELPKRVAFSYVTQAADYQTNEQHADRLVQVGSVGISNVALPAVLSDDVGAQIADSMLYSTWIERDSVVAYVSTKHLDLVPTDVVTLGASALRVRLTDVDTKLIGAIKLTGVIDFAPSYVSPRVGGVATALSTMAGLEGPTITRLLDVPILRDLDEGIIKYLAMSGVLDGWGGAILYKSTDSGKTFVERAQALTRADYGNATDVLGDYDSHAWDGDNTVNIRMASGALSSESELLVLNGANVGAFGVHGRWEIIQWMDVTLEGNGTYTLSNLLRGRRGTEHNTGDHVDSDTLIVLSETTINRLNDVAADIGAAYLYKGVSIGNAIQDTDQISFTNEGVSVKPFSPVEIYGTRDGSNNLTVTFHRRDRLGYRADFTLPMSEDTESYELEFWNTLDTIQYGGTKTDTNESYSYTAAQQTTDGATPGDTFLVKIYQMSVLVGRGYEGSAEV